MKGFDFSLPAVLHLGSGSRNALGALAIAIASAFAPAQAQSATPLVHVVPQPSQSEIHAQVDTERALHRAAASLARPESGGLSEQEGDDLTQALEAEDSRIQEARKAFSAGAETIAEEHGTGSCFGGFLEGQSDRTAVEESTILLVARDATGAPLSVGSGFIVRGSADASGHQRIATARHVVNPADLDPLPAVLSKLQAAASQGAPFSNPEAALGILLRKSAKPEIRDHADSLAKIIGGYDQLTQQQRDNLRTTLDVPPFDHVDAYASDGAYLGRVNIAAMGSPDGTRTQINGAGPYHLVTQSSDWAVMRVDTRSVSAAAMANYDKIPGLELADLQAPEKTYGMSGDGSRPAGTNGYSGGPVVDQDGRVHGIASAVLEFGDVIRTRVDGLVSAVNMAPGVSTSKHEI